MLQGAIDTEGIDPMAADLSPWRIETIDPATFERDPIESEAVTLATVWAQYVEALDISAYTKAGHYDAITTMIAKLGPSTLTDDRILAGYSRWTWHHRRAAIVRALRHGGHDEAAKHWASLRCPRTAKRRPDPDPLSVTEALCLYKATDAEFKGPLLFLLDTACRVGELLGVRWRDVDLEAQTVTIAGAMVRGLTGKHPHKRRWSRTGKSRKPRTIKLTPGLLALLSGMPRQHRLVFGNEMSAVQLRTAIDAAYKRSKVRRRKLSMSRHTRLSWVAEKSGLLAAARLAGHCDLQMVIRHYGRATEDPIIEDVLTHHGH